MLPESGVNTDSDRQDKYFAIGAAEFKEQEARFFLDKARDSSMSPREFRFYLDAALDAIDAAKEIAKATVGKDDVLSKVVGRQLAQFSNEETTQLVIANRIRAHHMTGRASLRGIFRCGELITDVCADDHVEYAVIITPGDLTPIFGPATTCTGPRCCS
jgi:hypothetical protein